VLQESSSSLDNNNDDDDDDDDDVHVCSQLVPVLASQLLKARHNA